MLKTSDILDKLDAIISQSDKTGYLIITSADAFMVQQLSILLEDSAFHVARVTLTDSDSMVIRPIDEDNVILCNYDTAVHIAYSTFVSTVLMCLFHEDAKLCTKTVQVLGPTINKFEFLDFADYKSLLSRLRR